MSAFDLLWSRFEESKEYREEFVSAQVKRGIPFQIRALLKQRGWTQERLARQAGLEQGVVSRAANPNYGNLTLNTIVRIAAGFDVAFVGRFVPFSELGKWFTNLSESEAGSVPSFADESRSALFGVPATAAANGDWEPVGQATGSLLEASPVSAHDRHRYAQGASGIDIPRYRPRQGGACFTALSEGESQCQGSAGTAAKAA